MPLTPEEIKRFITEIEQVKNHSKPLSDYFGPAVAEALENLIDHRVKSEREACAQLANSSVDDDGGFYRQGDNFNKDDPSSRALRSHCQRVAQQIRQRP